MKLCWVILTFSALVGLSCGSTPLDAQAWEMFKRTYGKFYQSPQQEEYRKGIFLDNMRKMAEHNHLFAMGQKSFRLGVNKYFDMHVNEIHNKGLTPKLMTRNLMMSARSGSGPIQFAGTGAKLPDRVDWRERGVVSPVKSQHGCLACYSFAAGDAIESQYAIKYGKKVLLSQQQIVDCSAAEGNLGCQGGMVDWAYQYVMKSGGLELESDYPYEVENGKCAFNASRVVASITNYGEVKNGSEIALQEAVAFYGPVSVSIDSSSFEWNYYTQGIFDYPYCKPPADVDHAVVVVGYGTENGKDYWLVKNSYGESFGDQGYIKMARNKNNLCNIASYANFPIIGKWEIRSSPPPAV